MAAVTPRKKSQVQQRQRNRTQSRRGRPVSKKAAGRHVNLSHRKKRSVGRYSGNARNLHFDSVRMTNEAQKILHLCVHDFYEKVSLAAERLRKQKHHVSITASDIKNTLKNFMPQKYYEKSISSISCKGHQ